MKRSLAQTQSPPSASRLLHPAFWRWGMAVVCLVGGVCGIGGPLLAQGTAVEPVAVEAPDAPVSATPATTAAAPTQPKEEPVTKLSTNLLHMIDSLGGWIVPFAIASIILLWFTVDRLVVLRRGRVIPRPFVQRFLRLLENGELEQDEALEVCHENQSPVSQVFAHAVRKWGKSAVEVEQAVIDGGERQVTELRRNLRILLGVHTITPMLGLLGTVWGMLDSFSQIATAGAMGRTDQLASGIALALVATVAGLTISIPALTLYIYFSGKVDALVTELDEVAQRVVHCISAEGLVARMGMPKKSVPNPPKPEPESAVARKR
jgi:biopolymer transport protein ExbB